MIRRFEPAAGGPPVVCGHLAASEARYGHSVRILTERAEGFRGEWPVVAVGPTSVAAALLPTSARRAIGTAVAGADLVHLHGVWDALLVAAAREAHARGVPYVVHPHGMLDPWCLAQRKWKKRLALALGVRWMLNRAACVRALNRDEAERLEPLGLGAPVRVVPNGIDVSELAPSMDELRRAVPELGGRPYVLFLGRLHHKKGLDLLAEAFVRVAAAHPGLQLLVAGANEGARHGFTARVTEAGLIARVHLPGPLYGPAKWAALAGAACFCLPSRQEGFSIAILEALASRVPVVISQACHFPEVAEAGAGVVTALTAEAVAAGLNRVLADPAAARAMGAAGRQLVETRYTWAHVGQLCERLERDTLAAPGAAMSELESEARAPAPANPRVDLPAYRNRLGRRNQAARALWGVVWLTAFRTSPRPFHGWRRFLLRCFGARIGRRVHVYPSAWVWAPWNLEMGDDSCLADGVDCYSVAPVRLGRSALVSQRSFLCAATHDYTDPEFPLVPKPIVVADGAWVAAEAFVGPGVTVGEGAVVGARACVTKSVEPWAVVAGNPARVVKRRELRSTDQTEGA